MGLAQPARPHQAEAVGLPFEPQSETSPSGSPSIWYGTWSCAVKVAPTTPGT